MIEFDPTEYINGCDSWLDGILVWSWSHCCDVHDIAYATPGEWWDRLLADLSLGTCVSAVAWPLSIVGLLMLVGTALFGWLFYRFRGRDRIISEDIMSALTKEKRTMASARAIQFIGSHEGKVLKAYLDPVHVLTIGYGFTWASRVFKQWWQANRGRDKLQRGDTMTEQEAFDVLKLVVENEYAPPVDRKFAGQAPHIRDAGTSMVYNCGAGALNWKWAIAVAKGNLKEGCRLWRTTATTAKKKRLPGLVRRRQEEADIAEFNRWPEWMTPTSIVTAPLTHVTKEDITQAQRWLKSLGYQPGEPDGIPGQRTMQSVRRFQQDHGQLKVDGIIGPATLSALQRAIDLRSKGTKVGAGAGATTVAGGAENVTGAGDDMTVGGGTLGWVGDLLFWGGIIVGLAVLGYLAWRYRDEIPAFLRRLA